MREVQDAMITWKPYQRPITTRLMTQKLGKKPSGNQKFEWIYSTLLPRTETITLSGGSASEDAITVVDSTLFQVGTKFVMDATGEVIIVDSIAGGNIDVTKVGSGNITAATTATCHFLGDSFEQGSSSGTAKSVNKNFEYNYCEIFKRGVHETRSQAATIEYGPDDFQRNKADRMEEFLMDIEMNFIAGVRDTNTGFQNGSHTQFHMGGVLDTTANFISGLYAYSGTTPTESYFFDTFIKDAYSQGSNEKTLYAGATIMYGLNNFSKNTSTLQTQVADKVFGVDIRKIVHNFGVLNLVWHPMLEGSTYGSKAILLDDGLGLVKYRYLAGNGINRDLQWEEFDYIKESDSRKGQWLAEVGIQVEGNPYHAVLEPA